MAELSYSTEYTIIQNFIDNGKVPEALKYLTNLKKNLGDTLSPQDQLSINLLQCIIHIALFQHHETLELFPKLEGKLTDNFMIYDLLESKILTYFYLGRLQDAHVTFTILEKIIPTIKDEYRTLRIYYLEGRTNRVFKNTEQAIIFYQKGIELANKLSNRNLLGKILNNLGHIYYIQGDLQLALSYFTQSLHIFESLSYKSLSAVVYFNIGEINRFMSNYEQAFDFYRQALIIYKQINRIRGLGFTYASLINLFLEENEIEKARTYLTEFRNLDLDPNSKEIPIIHCWYLLAEGLILKNSDRLSNKFSATLNFLEIIDGPDVETEIITQAVFNLTDIRLLEMKLTQNEDILVEIKSWLSKLFFIAEKQKSSSLLAQAYLLEAKLKILELKTNEAKENLLKGHDLANEHELKVLDQIIMQEYNQLLSQEKEFSNLRKKGGGSLMERINLTGLDKTLDELIRRRFNTSGLTKIFNQSIEPSIKDSNQIQMDPGQVMEHFYKMISNETYLSLFRQFKLGPEVFISDELKFSKVDKLTLELKMGMFFLTAIGQGNNLNQGLYGPLPFPDHDDYISIIYTCFIYDPENEDPRYKGKSYCLFVLTFLKTFEPYYRNSQFLTDTFKNFTKKFDKLQEITKESLDELKLALIT